MVSEHTHAIDSAPIKANVFMDSLELKVPEEDLEKHLHKLRHISQRDKRNKTHYSPSDPDAKIWTCNKKLDKKKRDYAANF